MLKITINIEEDDELEDEELEERKDNFVVKAETNFTHKNNQ
jgi:hypothetical protein